MARLTAKTSTIFIATAERTQVFHSVTDVPPALRKKLHQSTSGNHSATILIADRRGREELVRALQGLPSEVQSRLADNIRSHRQQQQQPPARTVNRLTSVRMWLELLVPVAAGVSLWLLISPHL